MTLSSADLFNVFSNLFALPAIFIALNFSLWATSALVASVASVSFLYHACQTGLFCIFSSDVPGEQDFFLLLVADQILVSLAIIWFAFYILEIPFRVTTASVLFTLPIFYLSYVSSTPAQDAIVWSVIGAFIGAAVMYVIILRKDLRFGILSTSAAIFLGTIGLILFLVDEDAGGIESNNYNGLHGSWHMLIFLTLFFVIYIKYEKRRIYIKV